MKRKNIPRMRILVFTVALLVLSACVGATPDHETADSGSQPAETKTIETAQRPERAISKPLQSNVQRELAPQASQTDTRALVMNNNAFSLEFYRAVRQQPVNLVYSPYSLSIALAMTYAGARGETEAQIRDTLHFDLPQERLHPAINAIDLALHSATSAPKSDEENQAFILNTANSIWGQADYRFLPAFLDTLALNYGAGLRLVDFQNAPEDARFEINRWVEDQTEEKIRDLIPEGAIDNLTRLVLTNAIYFNADWLNPFVTESTIDMPFTLIDGSQVVVPMMSHDGPKRLSYSSNAKYQAVELLYVGGTVSMLLIVPEAGQFPEFESTLDAALLGKILEDLEPRTVSLVMPKFSFSSSFELKQSLAEMGMPYAFDPGLADFSGMDGSHNLYISDVFHKAFIAVDEKGTEAAAASAVIVGIESAIESDVQLTIDRPFIFLIREHSTGSLIFVGRVINPMKTGE